MIYEQDVHEAIQFFPEQGDVILEVSDRKLLPYVRRALMQRLGTASSSTDMYLRYAESGTSLKIYLLVRDSTAWESVVREVDAPRYHVRKRGERLEPNPIYLDKMQDFKLASLCMSEADAVLYMSSKYPV